MEKTKTNKHTKHSKQKQTNKQSKTGNSEADRVANCKDIFIFTDLDHCLGYSQITE